MKYLWLSALLALTAVPVRAEAPACPSEEFGVAAVKKFNQADLAAATALALVAERQRPFSPLPWAVLEASAPHGQSAVPRLMLQAGVALALTAVLAAAIFFCLRLLRPQATSKAWLLAALAPLLAAALLQIYLASWDRVVSRGTLAARVLPDPGAASVGAIPGGSIGRRLQRQGDYALIDVAGMRGWVVEAQIIAVDEWFNACP